MIHDIVTGVHDLRSESTVRILSFTSTKEIALETTKGWDDEIYYSTDKKQWNVWNGQRIFGKAIHLKCDDYPAGNDVITGSAGIPWRFYGETPITTTGWLSSILSKNPSAYACKNMFKGNKSLINTVDFSSGYSSQFSLAVGIFQSMYEGCSGLVTINDFPDDSDEIPDWAYAYMFADCTSLVTPPTSLHCGRDDESVYGAYSCMGMFSGCTSLQSTPEFARDGIGIYGQQSLQEMFYNCTSLQSIYKITPKILISSYLSEVSQDCFLRMFYGAIPFSTTQTATQTNAYGPLTFNNQSEYSAANVMSQIFWDGTNAITPAFGDTVYTAATILS